VTHNQSDDCLTAGSARVNITPPLNIPYLGYCGNGRHSFFEGIHDPLYARAVVIGDVSARIALLSADSIGFARNIMGEDRDFISEVRQRIEHLCGIPSDHTMISATHAHSTPETTGLRRLLDHPGAAAWLETFADQLASAVALADRNRQPARLKRIVGSAEEMVASRRILRKDGTLYWGSPNLSDEEVADWGLTDPEVTLLCLEDTSGRPAIVMIHFACHPTTVQAQPIMSADFPGAATTFVENARIGCSRCIYLQGAAGDVSPAGGITGDFVDVARYEQVLAGEVIKLLGLVSAPDYTVAPARVDAVVDTVTLPSRELPDLEDLERERNEWEQSAKSAVTDQERNNARRQVALTDEKLERVRRGDAPVEAEVQVLRVGDTALVGIPGEPFAEFGLQVKAIDDAAATLCVGYTNGYLGYIAPPVAWQQGGYEVELGMWSIVGPQAFALLLNAVQTLVRRLF